MPHAQVPDPPPYSQHPIFKLRKSLLTNAAVGAVLSFIAAVVGCAASRSGYIDGWAVFVFVLAILCFGASALISWADLCLWRGRKKKQELEDAVQRASEPARLCEQCRGVVGEWTVERDGEVVMLVKRVSGERKEKKQIWPVRWLMIVEFIFTGCLVWVLFLEFGCIMGSYWDGGFITMWRTYASIPIIFAVVRHAKCCWLQYMHRKKQAWMANVNLENSEPESGAIRIGAGAEPRFADDVEAQRDAVPQIPNEDVELGTKIVERLRSGAITVADAVSQLNKEVKHAMSVKGKATDNMKAVAEGQILLGDECDDLEVGTSHTHEYGSTKSGTDSRPAQSTPSVSHPSWSPAVGRSALNSMAGLDNHIDATPISSAGSYDDEDDSAVVVKKKEKKGRVGK